MKSPKKPKSPVIPSSLTVSEEELENINDRYLQLIYETTPVEVLLKPMKGNSRKYRKYIIQLGKLDKRSPRVREKSSPLRWNCTRKGTGSTGTLPPIPSRPSWARYAGTCSRL